MTDDTPLALIPRPLHLERREGCCRLTSEAEIGITLDPNAPLDPEGYELCVTPTQAGITAAAQAGVFYALQTVRQLREGDRLPAVLIRDQPRFPWRGLMLDVSRHFFNVEEIKHFLDVMAAHKLNVFHWHLVDDPGWRIEIKRYPRLTEIGAWRPEIGFGLDPGSSRAWDAAGRYGGYFTQEQVRELVDYAADRHITIVPEIEMPGHSRAALAAYPEYSCTGEPYQPSTRGGIFDGIFCPGRDETFEFLENILAEVLELFPGEFIHVGGDEVRKDNWKQCARCQARMQAEGLANEEELQSWFIRRIERFISSSGRRLIGWDEILEGGLAPGASVMSWRGMQGGVTAALAGHDVVMTPTTHCYFDYYQGRAGQPKAIGGYLPLEKVYEFEPVAAEIPDELQQHVLGGGGNLWSEYFPNYGHVQYMAWPRACALAEVLWSPREGKDLGDFSARLQRHQQFLERLGVQYARNAAE